MNITIDLFLKYVSFKMVTLKCGDKQKHSLQRKDLKVNLNAPADPNTLFNFTMINYINFEAIVRCVQKLST